jgi:hypothetical protein
LVVWWEMGRAGAGKAGGSYGRRAGVQIRFKRFVSWFYIKLCKGVFRC